MKNKKFSQWLHRMPVLLLALILAVLPLTMAAPAHADVLSGGITSWSYSYDGLSVTADYYYPNVLLAVEGQPGNWLVVVIVSDQPLIVTKTDDNYYVTSNGEFGYINRNIFEVNLPSIDLRGAPLRTFLSYYTVENPVVIMGFGDFETNSFAMPLIQPVFIGGDGVLDTFYGVGSWLSGAVQNISTMFWTSETGMTVLGYLAVASLALAVILLIFYLIAGWLKFH